MARDLVEDEDVGSSDVTTSGAPSADERCGADRPTDALGVVATPWEGQDWALVVGSGSDLVALYDQIARLPAGLEFAEAFGDVDLVLVYRPADQAVTRKDVLGLLVEQATGNGGMLVGPVGAGGMSGSGRWMTEAERAAFAAGQADALSAVRRALTGAVGS
jgi:uncharacterized repeat protein (TIGR03917 family)